MSPRFGTSGLRGLVSALTEDLVADHVRAFLGCCETGGRVFVGYDLRPSSPALAEVVARTVRAAGQGVVMAGAVPTPALVDAARGAGAVMVTGSHIPADRNGLKFYTLGGEITKADEAAIVAGLGRRLAAAAPGGISEDRQAGARFVKRFIAACPPGALARRRLGVFSHSSVARDLLVRMLAALGAEVVELGRADSFVALDTEAVDADMRARLRGWARGLGLDAIVSADGDGDRPLVTDETGAVIPGDLLGQITAQMLGAETVVTPVSSNSGLEQKGLGRVIRTRIGSPYVIAAMQAQGGRVIGFEANGGVLLGFDARLPAGVIPALPTRDSFLPILCVLLAAGEDPLSVRVAREPARFTAADRLQDARPEAMARYTGALARDGAARAGVLARLGLAEAELDLTDGVRMLCSDGRIVHVRPSGNAPELRLYVETESAEASAGLLARGLDLLRCEMDKA
nr:phosphomannomutase [Rhodovulum bhavnagarense]